MWANVLTLRFVRNPCRALLGQPAFQTLNTGCSFCGLLSNRHNRRLASHQPCVWSSPSSRILSRAPTLPAMEDQATQAVLEFIERTQADEAVAESFLQVSIWSCGLMSRGNARGVVRNKGKGFHLTCGDATAGGRWRPH